MTTQDFLELIDEVENEGLHCVKVRSACSWARLALEGGANGVMVFWGLKQYLGMGY